VSTRQFFPDALFIPTSPKNGDKAGFEEVAKLVAIKDVKKAHVFCEVVAGNTQN